MKKIVGAVLAAAMLTGTAMADIGFSYTGSNFFTNSGANLKYDTGSRTDCMSVTLSGAAGGAVLDIDSNTSKSNGLELDEYYGWLNFALPAGSLQVTAGVWNGRYVNRVVTDAGKLKAADFEKFKPGVVKGSVGADSDNLTRGRIATVAAYTNNDVLPGTLMVKFGLVNAGEGNSKTTLWNSSASGASGNSQANPYAEAEDSDVRLFAGFAGEIAYRQQDLINVNLAVRSLQKKNTSVGLFISPLMIPKTQLTIGYTIATVQNYATYYVADEKGAAKANTGWQVYGTEWGVDIRARYKATDKLSITTMNNLSSYFTDSIPWGGTGADADKPVALHENNNTWILWNMLNATYQIADNLRAGLTLNSVIDGFDKDHACDGADITVSPSLRIQATERVSVTTGMRVDWVDVNFNKWTESIEKITIPVIFNFNY